VESDAHIVGLGMPDLVVGDTNPHVCSNHSTN
jgi:hypothetical protein